jgi:hypothetical protein
MLAWLVPENVSCVAGLMSSLTKHSDETSASNEQVNKHVNQDDATCVC